MLSKTLSRSSFCALRASATRAALRPRAPAAALLTAVAPRPFNNGGLPRSFHHSPGSRGILPDQENPEPKQSEPQQTTANEPSAISLEEYHEQADKYLELLQQKVEEKQDAGEGMELEYAAGVLTIEKAGQGTYVLNKQPPNKQIWLSSPITGPKRFDWVVFGESMTQKADGGVADWIYLRDGSSLTQLLRKELGIELGIDADVEDNVS
ncbi:uncharacterized protein K452DRAFT_318989 [Aplosporella prunicola CBS 121167]|uniref:ferroxidase n=1 Tax=Aplosporella prunicola CBS 121167 TaxID=1176127 RepID=A0A6A6BAT5_9PEZI|nr:uncharacterized protein K452DRAFT_318989 [Aplosporella prunicola CBS 121167]KAF2141352.1 hypothetical protein K452DRAFT_318989 [Aplosporella prunicola CBS 121167]